MLFWAVISAPRVAHPEQLPDIKTYAKERIISKWGEAQWAHFEDLIERESSWNSEAKNPKSTAYGLGQFLNSTWDDVGCVKTKDPYIQINCTISYVEQRYETPHGAIKFHNKKNYY